MDHQKVKGSFELLNVFTGEVEKLEFKNINQLKDIYVQLTTNAAAVKKATERIKRIFDEYLGEQDSFEFPDGYRLKRVQGELLEYRIEDLRKYLDEDQLSLVLKPNVTVLKALIKEMVERNELPGGTWKDIEEHAYHKPKKPFVILTR